MTRPAGPGAERTALFVVVAFVVAFTVLPAGYLFASSVAAAGGASGVLSVASDPATVAAVDHSLAQASVSAVLAVAAGYPAGVFLGRYSWRGREAVRSLLLVPFLLPSLVVVVGLLELAGPAGVVGSTVPAVRPLASGFPAIVATNLLFNVPIVMLFTASGCDVASVRLEESVATLGGSPWRAYREVWALPTWTGAAAGGLLTFVFSALSFAPPLLLCGNRCATVEVRIWELVQGSVPDPAAAGVLALLTVVGFLGPAAAYLLLARRLPSVRPVDRGSSRPVPWRSPVGWALAAVTATVLASEVALLGVVVLRSVLPAGAEPLGHGWSVLFASSTAARLGVSVPRLVENSLVFAGLAAGVALLVAVATSFAAVGRPGRLSALGLVAFVPVLLSPVVLAFSLSEFWGAPLGGAPNVWLLVVVSQALLGLPFALQSLELPLSSLPRAVRESAQTLGAGPWGAFVDAELPRVAPGIERAALFALALGLGEFTATFFLVTPSFTTVPVAVYALENRGLLPAMGAAAALLLFMSLAVYAATIVGVRRARL